MRFPLYGRREEGCSPAHKEASVGRQVNGSPYINICISQKLFERPFFRFCCPQTYNFDPFRPTL